MQSVKEWHDVTQQDFQEAIIPLYEPAIIKNAVCNWEVLKHVDTLPNILNKYRGNLTNSPPVEVFIGEATINGRYSYGKSTNELNFKRVRASFEELIKRLDSNISEAQANSMYAGGVSIESQMPLFSQYNTRPKFLEGAVTSPKVWLGNSANIATHFDVQDNIACLVSGEREFMLFPPEQVSNLYPGPLDRTIAGPPTSLVNINEPDFDKHPLYAKALESSQTAILQPGDALYIPSLWWHNVKSKGEFCMLVNYWWNNPSFRQNETMLSLVHGLYSISHLPIAERKAWRSLFDYYVFQLDAPPLEHLPDDQRGVLGSMTQERYELIQRVLLGSLGVRK